MDGKIEEMDRISNLPDFILHRILSFLPRRVAVRTCVLSKRWSSVWDSFPIFVFSENMYAAAAADRSTPEYKEKVREFMNLVDKAVQKFVQKKLRMERLSLIMGSVDHNFVSMIYRWILLALNNGVQEISISVSTDLIDFPKKYFILPKSLFAVKSVDGASTFHRLQSLSLQRVNITEIVIHDIIRSCPNINYFALEHFYGPKTVKISKLDKLESVSIVDALPKGQLDNISVDAPKLKYLNFDPYDQSSLPPKISLTSCHDLRELRLTQCSVSDDWLHLYLPRFPFLKNLAITCSSLLQRVRISGRQLKTFCLSGCANIESVHIDAPNLSSFKLITRTMPVLVSENVSCHMDIEYVVCAEIAKVDSSWFLKLRKFLGNSPQRKYFTLNYKNTEVCFDLEELGQVAIPSPIKIDCLKIKSFGIRASGDCAALIDGLLWSCHPTTISIPPGSTFQNNCIKVLCEKLFDGEHPVCCNSCLKCWRHDLKAVKIESFGGIEDKQFLHFNMLLDTLPSLTKDQEVCINLEWEF